MAPGEIHVAGTERRNSSWLPSDRSITSDAIRKKFFKVNHRLRIKPRHFAGLSGVTKIHRESEAVNAALLIDRAECPRDGRLGPKVRVQRVTRRNRIFLTA